MNYEEQIRIPFEFFEANEINIPNLTFVPNNTPFWKGVIRLYRGYSQHPIYGDISIIRGVDTDWRSRVKVIIIEYEKEFQPHQHKIPRRLIKYKPTIKVKIRTVRCL